MLLMIIRKEIVHNILSFRFVVTYALLICLILLAMFLMADDFAGRSQTASTETKQERGQLEELDAIEDSKEKFRQLQQRMWSVAGVRLPQPLSVVARGLENALPMKVASNTWFLSSSGDERLGRNQLFDLFQTPDLLYVINIILSLLALLFVYDSVCGEKERGTLKLLLSNSVPRDLVLLGKWIGGYISIAAPFTVAVLGGFTYIYIAGVTEVTEDFVNRFGLIYLVSLVYLSAFFTLGLVISTLTHRTATALLTALMVWIAWILVVPNLSPVIARLTAPVPSLQVIEGEKQAIDRESQVLMESLGRRNVYGDQNEREKLQKETEKRKNKLDEFYRDRMAGQVSLSKNLARLSPSASYLLAATRLAGTGPVLADQFQRAQKRYMEQMEEYRDNLNDQARWERSENGNWEPQIDDENFFDLDQFPRFRMQAERLSDSFNAALFDVLLLVVFNILFFILAYIFFLRYDVT